MLQVSKRRVFYCASRVYLVDDCWIIHEATSEAAAGRRDARRGWASRSRQQCKHWFRLCRPTETPSRGRNLHYTLPVTIIVYRRPFNTFRLPIIHTPARDYTHAILQQFGRALVTYLCWQISPTRRPDVGRLIGRPHGTR